MIVFWRATKAAIARFHPAHQTLIWERRLATSGPAADWQGFVASVAQHDRHVRRARWALPPRTVAVLVPLVRALSADLAPGEKLTVTADLRGAQVPDKQRPSRSHPVRPPFRSAVDSFAVDPWLQLEATLRDGSAVRIVVVDTIRSRRVVRTNPRGKVKAKTKVKATQRISATRRFGRQQHLVHPAGPPPPWIAVRIKPGQRVVVRARATVGLQQATEETEVLLTVLTEVFRWTPPQGARPGGAA